MSVGPGRNLSKNKKTAWEGAAAARHVSYLLDLLDALLHIVADVLDELVDARTVLFQPPLGLPYPFRTDLPELLRRALHLSRQRPQSMESQDGDSEASDRVGGSLAVRRLPAQGTPTILLGHLQPRHYGVMAKREQEVAHRSNLSAA